MSKKLSQVSGDLEIDVDIEKKITQLQEAKLAGEIERPEQLSIDPEKQLTEWHLEKGLKTFLANVEFEKEDLDKKIKEEDAKISALEEKAAENSKAENFRKLILATSKDIRVLLVKLADRLHNLRTISYLSKIKQRRFALESKEIFAPLAHRIGMNTIKMEMEDIIFSIHISYSRWIKISTYYIVYR